MDSYSYDKFVLKNSQLDVVIIDTKYIDRLWSPENKEKFSIYLSLIFGGNTKRNYGQHIMWMLNDPNYDETSDERDQYFCPTKYKDFMDNNLDQIENICKEHGSNTDNCIIFKTSNIEHVSSILSALEKVKYCACFTSENIRTMKHYTMSNSKVMYVKIDCESG